MGCVSTKEIHEESTREKSKGANIDAVKVGDGPLLVRLKSAHNIPEMDLLDESDAASEIRTRNL